MLQGTKVPRERKFHVPSLDFLLPEWKCRGTKSPDTCVRNPLVLAHWVTHRVWLHLAIFFSNSSKNCHFFGLVQPVGLVDYESLKKSIWWFLLFSRRCLKEFTDDTEISSSDKLFQRFMTRWGKNCSRVLQRSDPSQFIFWLQNSGKIHGNLLNAFSKCYTKMRINCTVIFKL